MLLDDVRAMEAQIIVAAAPTSMPGSQNAAQLRELSVYTRGQLDSLRFLTDVIFGVEP